MTLREYEIAFAELRAFNRERMGDDAWLKWYIDDCVFRRNWRVVVVPRGRYVIAEWISPWPYMFLGVTLLLPHCSLWIRSERLEKVMDTTRGYQEWPGV